MRKKFLALVGSPRPNSTSGYFADYLVEAFVSWGWQTQNQTACQAVRQCEKWPVLESAFREADVVGIITPLYVDGLPAELTATLERLSLAPVAPKRIFGVVNCGFFEADHTDTGLDICRLFTREIGSHWAGGLGIGGGGMFSGKPLKQQGGAARHILRAFDQSAASLAAGEDLPQSAIQGIRKPAIPSWLYFALGNFGMMVGAAKNGVLHKIRARPYGEKPTF